VQELLAKKNLMIEDKEPYCLELAWYECSDVRTRLKFSILKRHDIMNETDIVLCAQCASFLIFEQKQTMKNVWPAFM
jgi:hypothetical protein